MHGCVYLYYSVKTMEIDPILIEFLLNPANYPEHVSAIDHFETHISHVFVCDGFAYKIKKPVNLGFLDFTTLKKRLYFCKQEVALNSRLADETYLGVEAIYKKGNAYSFRRQVESAVAEYAVKMKKIPYDCMLSRLIEEGWPLYGELEPVGRTLARFHRETRIYKGAAYGGIDTMKAATEENFEQIRPFCGVTIDDTVYDQLVTYTRQFIGEHERKFTLRKKHGWVRDGHGDLHSQHICLEKPPVIFDCIEFNEAFRIIDVLEDIAFLFMDLEYRARFDLSARLFKAYFAHHEESFDEDLLRFYKIYRAVVRGKVEGFRGQDLPEGVEKKEAFRAAREYFLLAGYYINYFAKPFNPVVFMGLSGSGKSTIARDFSPNWVILRSDEIRKVMSGMKKDEHRFAGFGEDIYSNGLTRDVYCTLLERALDGAGQGKRVVVDATYLKQNQRRYFFQSCMEKGLNPFFVHCTAGESVLRTRIMKRMEQGLDISDAHIAILEQQIRDMEEPVELPFYRVMRLNTENELHNIVSALKEFL